MKFFTKNESIIIGLILILIVGVSLSNLRVANRRARDAQRRDDLRSIANALDKYNSEFAFFPPSVDGTIMACKGDKYDEFVETQDTSEVDSFFDLLRGCAWGVDPLVDLTGKSPPYLSVIPADPTPADSQYLYLSSGKRYQLFTHLEGGQKAEQYDETVAKRQLDCGGQVCNFAIAFGLTPVDRSLEEYEAELEEYEN